MIKCWRNYDLTKASEFMKACGWDLKCHVIVIGPFGFCILWRKKKETK